MLVADRNLPYLINHGSANRAVMNKSEEERCPTSHFRWQSAVFVQRRSLLTKESARSRLGGCSLNGNADATARFRAVRHPTARGHTSEAQVRSAETTLAGPRRCEDRGAPLTQTQVNVNTAK